MPNNFDLQLKWLNGSQIEIQANDGSSLTGVEKILVMQGGVAKEFTSQQVADLGGSSSYLVASVTLTDAQIKAIPQSGAEILPAPGANKMYNIINCVLHINTSAGAYTGTANTALYLSPPGSPVPLLSCLSNSDFLGTTGNRIHILSAPNTETGSGAVAGFTITNNTSDYNNWTNKAVYLFDWNVGTNYGGGNAANTLKVKVYYVIVDL